MLPQDLFLQVNNRSSNAGGAEIDALGPGGNLPIGRNVQVKGSKKKEALGSTSFRKFRLKRSSS